MNTKTVTDFEIISHGVDHAQYFQGCGVSYTRFEEVATGCGMSEKEALDDAIDSLIQNGWDCEAIDQSDDYVNSDIDMPIELAEQGEDGELYYYASIRVTSQPHD